VARHRADDVLVVGALLQQLMIDPKLSCTWLVRLYDNFNHNISIMRVQPKLGQVSEHVIRGAELPTRCWSSSAPVASRNCTTEFLLSKSLLAFIYRYDAR
jgi:hypothetical protein